MNIFDNSLVLARVYNFCSYEGKQNLKLALNNEFCQSTLEHTIKHAKHNYPCHVCMLELSFFYSCEGVKFVRYLMHEKDILQFTKVIPKVI